MSTHEAEKPGTTWETLWAGLQSEWLKLETLQFYYVDQGGSFAAWLEGDREESMRLIRGEYAAWDNEVMRKREAGVRLRRVRVIDKPLTPYVEWELEAFKRFSIPNGEQILVVTKSELDGLTLPQGDLQQFDDRLYFHGYDAAARWTSMTHVTGEEAALYQRLLSQILTLARPLNAN